MHGDNLKYSSTFYEEERGVEGGRVACKFLYFNLVNNKLSTLHTIRSPDLYLKYKIACPKQFFPSPLIIGYTTPCLENIVADRWVSANLVPPIFCRQL